MTPPSFLIDQVAKDLKISRRTVYNMIHDGRLQAIKVGCTQRVTFESVEFEKRRREQDFQYGTSTKDRA